MSTQAPASGYVFWRIPRRSLKADEWPYRGPIPNNKAHISRFGRLTAICGLNSYGQAEIVERPDDVCSHCLTTIYSMREQIQVAIDTIGS